jgi:AraC-like DNA-binding protein
VLSTRGASGVGEMDVAYIADRGAVAMRITETGLPDYCLTLVSRGALTCIGAGATGRFEANKNVGVIYRGHPGTVLSASRDHERLAIWIPFEGLRQRLAGLLGGAVSADIVFDPLIDLTAPPGRRVERLVRLLVDEFDNGRPFGGSEIACRSYTDLLLLTMLCALPHNYSDRVMRTQATAAPGTVRRAEHYIHEHAHQPIALHEVAEAAGCSVRSLQLGFRQFRDLTPSAAIVRARLEAVRRALREGQTQGTLTQIALGHGFTNLGRFTKLYTAAFGVSPANERRSLAAGAGV